MEITWGNMMISNFTLVSWLSSTGNLDGKHKAPLSISDSVSQKPVWMCSPWPGVKYNNNLPDNFFCIEVKLTQAGQFAHWFEHISSVLLTGIFFQLRSLCSTG